MDNNVIIEELTNELIDEIISKLNVKLNVNLITKSNVNLITKSNVNLITKSNDNLIIKNIQKNTKPESKYYCYVLRSINPLYLNNTYNGSTNNLKRRLRQHNGEIVGGAKATRGKRPWVFYILMDGFKSHKEALSCEWRIKHPTGARKRPIQYSGIKGRVKSLNLLINLDCWTSKSTGLESGNPYKLYLSNEHIELIDQNLKKPNIELLLINEILI